MASAGVRQIMISRLIPQEPGGITVTGLHARLLDSGILVSLRTVQRDLNELSTILDLQYRTIGRVRYWYQSRRGHPSMLMQRGG